jgi:hypothetical protein
MQKTETQAASNAAPLATHLMIDHELPFDEEAVVVMLQDT